MYVLKHINTYIYKLCIEIHRYTSFKSSSFLVVSEYQVGTQLNKNVIRWIVKHAQLVKKCNTPTERA